MRSVEQALEAVGAAAGAPRARGEDVLLRDALGRVLAADVRIEEDVPPFRRATMDGYAVRAADLAAGGAVLAVAGRVPAGAGWDHPLRPGEAAAIMTGAPVPEGADAVVPIERADLLGAARGTETRVRFVDPAREGQHVARQGELAARGDVVATAGEWIHPGTVGVLAAAGCERVRVAARPRVAILATGDEIVPAAQRPGPHQIRDSNGHALVAQCARAGALGLYGGPQPDARDALVAAIRRALEEAEVLCLTGGVSMGERDLVPAALAEAGVVRRFHRWNVKPGGPLWFGERGDRLVFGLPGNPGATFVGFEVLVVPALRTRLGLPFAPRATVPALVAGPAPQPTPRRQYVPVDLGVGVDRPFLVARFLPWRGSADLFALRQAAGLGIVPEVDAAPRGEAGLAQACVEVLPLGTFLGRPSA